MKYTAKKLAELLGVEVDDVKEAAGVTRQDDELTPEQCRKVLEACEDNEAAAKLLQALNEVEADLEDPKETPAAPAKKASGKGRNLCDAMRK